MAVSSDIDEPLPADPGPQPHHQQADPRVRRTAVLVGAAIVLLSFGAFLTLRFGSSTDATSSGAGGWHGEPLSEPQPKPPIRLTDTDGTAFDLQSATEGDLTLVMFGYTNCTDVCPITLATLQAALDQLGPEVADRVHLVFVTADPVRDTPAVLRSYLDRYNTEFVGLTGTPDEIEEAQEMASVPPAMPGEEDSEGTYTVGHATQLIAYQGDGVARITYPFGTRQQDWIGDLPRLLAGETPSP